MYIYIVNLRTYMYIAYTCTCMYKGSIVFVREHVHVFNPLSQFSRLGIQVSYYLFFPVLIMYIMCIVCLGYLSFLPTSAIASVLCTCISMYICTWTLILLRTHDEQSCTLYM